MITLYVVVCLVWTLGSLMYVVAIVDSEYNYVRINNKTLEFIYLIPAFVVAGCIGIFLKIQQKIKDNV